MAIGYSSNMKKSQATQESVTTSYQTVYTKKNRKQLQDGLLLSTQKKCMHTCRKTKQKTLHHLKANLP